MKNIFEHYTIEHNQILLEKHTPAIEAGRYNADDIAPWCGCMYETFGDELDYVMTIPHTRVWTVIQEGEEEPVIVAGRWRINRMGYLVSKEEWKDEKEMYA